MEKSEKVNSSAEITTNVPFHLVTGFLGSGKTTFLKSFLARYGHLKRIALIQNEFASTGIDGKELKDSGWRFDLLEINKGSVFCVCLFSDFRLQLQNFVEQHRPDIVLLEATGLADPIAISELLMDEKLQRLVYLSKVWTVIDAQNYEKVKKMPAVINQIVIADNIIVNKTDLISVSERGSLEMEISTANPLAKIILTSYCKLDIGDLYTHKELFFEGKPAEAMKDVKTQVFKTPYTIKRKNLDFLIKTLDQNSYRLKGYLILDNNEAVMIQSVFGNTTLTPVDKTMHTTEIISLGRKTIDFEYILRKLILI